MIMFFTKVKKIERKSRVKRGWKDEADKAQFETEDMGWFLLLDGSWEYLYVGDTPPDDLSVGDAVTVTITKT